MKCFEKSLTQKRFIIKLVFLYNKNLEQFFTFYIFRHLNFGAKLSKAVRPVEILIQSVILIPIRKKSTSSEQNFIKKNVWKRKRWKIEGKILLNYLLMPLSIDFNLSLLFSGQF